MSTSSSPGNHCCCWLGAFATVGCGSRSASLPAGDLQEHPLCPDGLTEHSWTLSLQHWTRKKKTTRNVGGERRLLLMWGTHAAGLGRTRISAVGRFGRRSRLATHECGFSSNFCVQLHSPEVSQRRPCSAHFDQRTPLFQPSTCCSSLTQRF
jgi:hypothetical protein